MKLANRWKVLLFLFFATVLNYIDRQTLSVSSPLIQKEFALDNEHLGLLFSGFYFSYAVSVAFIGELIDRIPLRKSFLWIVTWWSGVTTLTAISGTFWHLLGFRILLGIGEAGLWPATARLIALSMEPEERTLANSLYMAGGSLGLVVVQPLMTSLSLAFGWRAGFVFIGMLSTFWILGWTMWFRPKKEAELYHQDTAVRGPANDWKALFLTARFWGYLTASFCGNTCLYFLMNWLPTFFTQDRHLAFNLKLGGMLLIPFLGLDGGYLVSGVVTLRLSKHFPRLGIRSTMLALAAILLASALAYTPFAASSGMLLTVLFGTTFAMAVWNSNYLSGVEEISSVKPASVAGVVGSVGAIGGAISLWLIGLVTQLAGSFRPVFLMMAVLIVIGTAAILLTDRKPAVSSV